jgi:hypothetical protein
MIKKEKRKKSAVIHYFQRNKNINVNKTRQRVEALSGFLWRKKEQVEMLGKN